MDTSFERPVLAYDGGGSHVSCALCSSKSLRLGPVARESYSAQNSSSAFLDMLERLGREAGASIDGILGAELAFPGPLDFSAGISLMRHKLVYLYGVDLRITQLFDRAPLVGAAVAWFNSSHVVHGKVSQ